MKEQMPDLMPKVMDNLMPHMIGKVVPLVTQPMIDYLRGRGRGGDQGPGASERLRREGRGGKQA
jgi:hypothetical protein